LRPPRVLRKKFLQGRRDSPAKGKATRRLRITHA
jgi:hypothetical protein